MSGPKTSIFSLAAGRRMIIAQQLERQRYDKESVERIKLINAQREKNQQLKSNINGVIQSIYKLIERARHIESEMEESIIDQSVVEEICKEAEREINTTTFAEEDMERLLKSEKVFYSLQERLKACEERLKKSINRMEDGFKKDLISIMESGFNISFASLQRVSDPKVDALINTVQDTLMSIADMCISDELQEEYRKIKQQIQEIDNSDFLENYYAITLIPFLNECKNFVDDYNQYGQDYETLKQKYMVLANEAGENIIEVAFSKEGIKKLKSEIARLEEKIIYMEEQNFISHSIDEVMVDMGYKLIGNRSVVKKSGKHFKNELYLFDEGTAVNVTFADNGQITMELGGLGNANRVPEQEETDVLCRNMTEFCDEYKVLETELSKRGIIAKKISIMPPEAQFAQIFNISEYNMIEKVEYLQASRRKGQMNQEKLHKEV